MVQIAKLGRKRLGEILVEEGFLKEAQIPDVLKRQRVTGELFGEALVNLNYVTDADIARALVKHFSLPYIDASRYRISRDAIDSVPRELMWQNRFIVLDKIGPTLMVAISGALNLEVFQKLEQVSGSKVSVYITTGGQAIAALNKNAPLNGAENGKSAQAEKK